MRIFLVYILTFLNDPAFLVDILVTGKIKWHGPALATLSDDQTDLKIKYSRRMV